MFVLSLHIESTYSRAKKKKLLEIKVISCKKDLGMACHTPPLKKAKETRGNAITQPQSHPFKNVEFRDGKGLKLDDGSSPCFFAFLRGGV